jgi:hypothetical protein
LWALLDSNQRPADYESDLSYRLHSKMANFKKSRVIPRHTTSYHVIDGLQMGCMIGCRLLIKSSPDERRHRRSGDAVQVRPGTGIGRGGELYKYHFFLFNRTTNARNCKMFSARLGHAAASRICSFKRHGLISFTGNNTNIESVCGCTLNCFLIR